MANHIAQAIVLASKDFSLDIPSAEVSTAEDFQNILTELIRHLLDKDFERLINGLYRIDVSEEKVKQAMATGDDVAGQIALLIIERELQKVRTREKYRN